MNTIKPRVEFPSIMKTILIVLSVVLLVSLGINAWSISQISNLKKGFKDQEKKMTRITEDVRKLGRAPTRRNAQPEAQKEVLVQFDNDYIKGDPNAPVTILEFSDYQCPFCRRFHTEVLPKIEEEYISTGKVRYVFRDYPLSFHKKAIPAAVAANCAGEQGKYWEMNDFLFTNPNKLDTEILIESSPELGLDKSKFEACVNDDSKREEVDKDFQDGRRYGVRGTPSLFIGKTGNGKEMNATYIRGLRQFDALKPIIEKNLSAN